MFFAAKLGGVSSLWPKIAILRDPPPLKVFLAASLSAQVFKYLFNLSLFEPEFIIVFCFICVQDKDIKSEVCQLFNESNLPGVFWKKMRKLVVFFEKPLCS